MTKKSFLAVDIGGTKTYVLAFNPDKGPSNPVAFKKYSSKKFDSPESIIRHFVDDNGITVQRAAVAVAGPVIDGTAQLTNLPHSIDERILARNLGMESAVLMNDLLATAAAIPHLEDDDLLVLHEGKINRKGAIAVIAPGTGLGEGYLIRDGHKHTPLPSEGGHADFAPKNDFELGLFSFLKERHGRVSYERVLSGPGIRGIYEYLLTTGMSEPEWLTDELAKASDPSPVITKAGVDDSRECGICRKTIETFVSVLGSESGNMGLRFLANGGVYLGGGIVPRILSVLQSGIFMEAFLNKGSMSPLLHDIPVKVILNDRTALLGAAWSLLIS